MKILLIRPKPWEYFSTKYPFYELADFTSPSTFPPLGLLYLGGALERDGHTVEIIDCCRERNDLETIEKSIESADVIGFTVTLADYKTTDKLTKIIKEKHPNLPIIIGGAHCTFFQERVLESIPNADISVMGEADYTIIQIIRYFQGKKSLSDIPGIFYKKNNKIYKGKTLKIIKDLNELHFPARHLVEKYDYGKVNGNYLFKPKLTSMISSKGCPFKCRFCSRYSNFINGWKVRERSAENVVKELIEIDKNYGSVFIVDDNFLANKKRAHLIMDGLMKNKTDIELLIEGARVDSADRKLYRKMKKANVKLIGFGIESGNQDVLDYYNKKFTVEQARKAVKLANKMGFITMATFILGAPIETKAHIENTIKFAYSLPLDIAFFGPLYFSMWSQLWSEAVKSDKIPSDGYSIPVDSRKGIGNFTIDELKEYTKEASRNFYLRPQFMLSQVVRAFQRKDFRLVTNGFNALKTFKKEKLFDKINPTITQ